MTETITLQVWLRTKLTTGALISDYHPGPDTLQPITPREWPEIREQLRQMVYEEIESVDRWRHRLDTKKTVKIGEAFIYYDGEVTDLDIDLRATDPDHIEWSDA